VKAIPISPVDALFANGGYPIEFLFFYPDGLESRALRAALRRLARPLWPAFGTYRDGHLHPQPYRESEIYDEARDAEDFPAHLADCPDPASLQELMLPPLERLLFLRLLQFRDGTGLILKLSHLAGDGYSYFYLLSLLAASTRQGGGPLRSILPLLAARPHHRRSAVMGSSLTDDQLPPVPATEVGHIVIESVPRREVMAVIREVSRSGEGRISTNDVLTARALQHILDERAGSFGGDINLTIPIDVRRHVRAFGRRFFGNALQMHRMSSPKEGLRDLPTVDLAGRIRATMPEVTPESYRTYLAGLDELARTGDRAELRPYDPAAGCLVTNLSRLPLPRLDFGTGPPSCVLPLTVGRHATLILSQGDRFVLRLAY
jgi:hypothetical protein